VITYVISFMELKNYFSKVVVILGQYLGLIYIAAALFIAAVALLPEETITKLAKHQCGYWTVFIYSAISVLCSIVEVAVLAYWIATGRQPANLTMILFNVGIVTQLAAYFFGSLYLHRQRSQVQEGAFIKK